MHRFGAIEIENAENFRRIAFGWNAAQREACKRAQIHGDDALLLGEIPVDAFHHERRAAVADHVAYDALACLEIGFRQPVAFAVHSRGISERVGSPRHDERAFGAADLESGFQDLLQTVFRGEDLVPLLLKVQNN